MLCIDKLTYYKWTAHFKFVNLKLRIEIHFPHNAKNRVTRSIKDA